MGVFEFQATALNVSMIKNHQLQVGDNAGQEVKEARLAMMQAWTGKMPVRVGRRNRSERNLQEESPGRQD